jgi:hypothetical protein
MDDSDTGMETINSELNDLTGICDKGMLGIKDSGQSSVVNAFFSQVSDLCLFRLDRFGLPSGTLLGGLTAGVMSSCRR